MRRILGAAALLCLLATTAAAAARTAQTFAIVVGDAVTIEKLNGKGPGAVRVTADVLELSGVMPLDYSAEDSAPRIESTAAAKTVAGARVASARTTVADFTSGPSSTAGAQATAAMKTMGSSPRFAMLDTDALFQALPTDPLPFSILYAPKGKNPANKEDLVVLVLQSTSPFSVSGSSLSVDAVVLKKGDDTLAVTGGMVEFLNTADASKRAQLTGETTTSAPVHKADEDTTPGYTMTIDFDGPMPKR